MSCIPNDFKHQHDLANIPSCMTSHQEFPTSTLTMSMNYPVQHETWAWTHPCHPSSWYLFSKISAINIVVPLICLSITIVITKYVHQLSTNLAIFGKLSNYFLHITGTNFTIFSPTQNCWGPRSTANPRARHPPRHQRSSAAATQMNCSSQACRSWCDGKSWGENGGESYGSMGIPMVNYGELHG